MIRGEHKSKEETAARRAVLQELRRAGHSVRALSARFGVSVSTIKNDLYILNPLAPKLRTTEARQSRLRELPSLFADGLNPDQLAAHFHITVAVIRRDLQVLGLPIARYHSTRHDSNRIVDQMALEASCLLADQNLITFEALDRSLLPEWLRTFQDTQFALARFLRLLRQAQQTPTQKTGGNDGTESTDDASERLKARL